MPDIFTSSQSKKDSDKQADRNHQPPKHVDQYSAIMREETPSSNPFDAFAPKPQNVCFDAQLHNEHVLLLLRRHPITQVPWILVTIGLLLFPLIMPLVFPVEQLLPARYVLALFLSWYILVGSFALESFLVWFFNVNIITDERVIDVDFNSLIYKNISAAKIDNIEDITATTGGAVRSVFDFGTIMVQTAAAVTEFEFEDIPHPAKVTALLNELLLEEEREKAEGRVN